MATRKAYVDASVSRLLDKMGLEHSESMRDCPRCANVKYLYAALVAAIRYGAKQAK